MPNFRSGEVTEILDDRDEFQRVLVEMDGDRQGRPVRAFALTGLTGSVMVGDRVVCNTTAVDLGLGTGGWHVVHWVHGRTELISPGGGHIMKLRYTSLQCDAGAAEESWTEDQIEAFDDLGGMPVIACTVHSQLAPVAAAFHKLAPGRRLVHVMTDGASLPLAMSDTVAQLRDSGVLESTITVGHAFGGDREAVAVPSGLLVARHDLAADAAVVSMGPGVVGTGTPLGNTGVEAAAVLQFAAGLGGRGILSVRASEADRRERHSGVSHHVRAILRLCFAPLVAPLVPRIPAADVGSLAEVQRSGQTLLEVATPPVSEWLSELGLAPTTMGRSVDEDLLFFESAAAAGALAAAMLDT